MAYTRTGTKGIFTRGDVFYIAGRDPITKKLAWTKSGTSLQEAKSLKRQLDEQRARGISTQESRLTVPELWTEFEANHLVNLSPSTRADYTSAYTRYIKPRYAKARIVDITRAEALAFRTQLGRAKSVHGKPLSPKRIRNITLVFQSMLRYAQATGHIQTNPMAEARRGERLPSNPPRDYALTPGEMRQLLRAIKQVNPAQYPLFLTLARTAMRLSEALELRAEDVDLHRRTIRVSRSVYRHTVKSTKTGHGRTVGVSDELHEVLQEQLQGKTGLIFASRRDSHQDPNGIRRHVWEPALAKSGLPEHLKKNLHIHDIRHSVISWWIAGSDGAPPLSIPATMKLSGHRSVQSLMVYAHAAEQTSVDQGIDILNALEVSE